MGYIRENIKVVHTHILVVPELGIFVTVKTFDEDIDWERALPDVEKKP